MQDDPQRDDNADDDIEGTGQKKHRMPGFIVQYVQDAKSDLDHYIATAAAATGVKIVSSELVVKNDDVEEVRHHDWHPATPQQFVDQVGLSIRRPALDVMQR
jgi:hypothetical protein